MVIFTALFSDPSLCTVLLSHEEATSPLPEVRGPSLAISKFQVLSLPTITCATYFTTKINTHKLPNAPTISSNNLHLYPLSPTVILMAALICCISTSC